MAETTEMTVIERIADAIDSSGIDPFRLQTARRVLQAIREPSEAMIHHGGLNHAAANCEHIWQRMIDAALEEG